MLAEGVTWIGRKAFIAMLQRLQGAERLSALRWRCNLAGTCEAPPSVTVGSRPDRNRAYGREWIRGRSSILLMHLEVKCRKCRDCLRRRAAHWRLRCLTEGMAAPRTWFGTLTIDPHHRTLLEWGAIREASSKGCAWGLLTADERFMWKARHGDAAKTFGTELTLFLKRVRKTSAAELRYCIVAEAHQSGDPHFHVLMHEVRHDQAVRKRRLKDAWQVGFSDWRLVTDTANLTYACKYLSKSSLTRVRASQGYGRKGFDALVAEDMNISVNALTSPPSAFLLR